STWIAELSEEWRFGELGVVKVTAFHDWISDVEDLLPLTPEFEVPGNIGDGRRWGVELESTLPLQVIGLTGAKLDAKLRWQDSTVTDPVTGRSRVLTAEGGSSQDIVFENENRYSVILDFRQDLEAAKVAWGWHYATRAERPLFKVNELEIYDEGTQLNAFIETTRWWGLKIRFTANNILDVVDTRDRTIYTGERDLSPVDYRELRTLTNGTRLILSFSGAF
ncbi:MAG: TonB-dependent receptor, partial [Woeseiaceae bacterium]